MNKLSQINILSLHDVKFDHTQQSTSSIFLMSKIKHNIDLKLNFEKKETGIDTKEGTIC